MTRVGKAAIAVFALTGPPERARASLGSSASELEHADFEPEISFGLSPLTFIRLTKASGEKVEALWLDRGQWAGWDPEQRAGALETLSSALREAGVRQIVACGEVQAANSILDPGDLIVPADLVDYHRVPAHLPSAGDPRPLLISGQTRALLLEAAREVPQRRLFLRGIYGSLDRWPTAAEARVLVEDGIDVAGLDLGLDLRLAQSLQAELAGIYLVAAGAGIGSDDNDDPSRQDLSQIVLTAVGIMADLGL